MNWIPSQTIIGPPAEGDKFLRRPHINREFWQRIEAGEHIIFTAPRRVGKSSIMKDIEANCPDGYLAIYHDIESDRTQNDFFKRLFDLLMLGLNKREKLIAKAKQWVSRMKVGEITLQGLQIQHDNPDYKAALLGLLEELGDEGHCIIYLLDEFPDVIRAIANNEGREKAIDTLQTLRSVRHDARFRNFRFVFAGSVGIEHVVGAIDRLKVINDLRFIRVEVLTEQEARQLVRMLTDGATIQIGPVELEYLLQKIDFLLPYYIQLMIEKCDSLLSREERAALTSYDVDVAFDAVIQEGNNFGDWERRLSDYLDVPDTRFCVGILTRCAHAEPYPIQKLYDYSKAVAPTTHYKELIDEVLVKDGYLVEVGSSYRFLSPFLKGWWKRRHPEEEI